MEETGNDSERSRTTRGGQAAEHKRDLKRAAFFMSVEGKTYREIADELGINKETVCNYVREEEQARAQELGERREAEKARRIARLQHLSRLAEESRSIPGSGALGACGKFEEMINKILGVDAPTKIEVGVQSLLEALNGGSEETQ